jgi:hypothetical protein
MFNANNFLTRPQKFILEQNFKSYLYDSVNKYNKLTIQINEEIKRKNEIQQILYGNENKNALIKTTNHSVNDLINNAKHNNFIFIVSFVSFISLGGLIFYKNR